MEKFALRSINGYCEIYNYKKHIYDRYDGEFYVLTDLYINYSEYHCGLLILSFNGYTAYLLNNFGYSLNNSWKNLKKYNINLILCNHETIIGSKIKEDAERFLEYLESLEVMRKLIE